LFQQDIGPFLRALGYAYSNSDINKAVLAISERRSTDSALAWSPTFAHPRCCHRMGGKAISGKDDGQLQRQIDTAMRARYTACRTLARSPRLARASARHSGPT